MRNSKTSIYKKTVGISRENHAYLDRIRGRKSLAGKLTEIIEFYQASHPVQVSAPNDGSKELILMWSDLWQKANGGDKPVIMGWGRYMKQVKGYIKELGLDEMKRLVELYFLQFDDQFIVKNNWALNIFLTEGVINKLRRL